MQGQQLRKILITIALAIVFLLPGSFLVKTTGHSSISSSQPMMVAINLRRLPPSPIHQQHRQHNIRWIQPPTNTKLRTVGHSRTRNNFHTSDML
ncbi:MAG: hypothetical protein AUI50_08595 [Crenarchaeota archaeon 13_1_40CM_2_52_14]|nr:MAG: hypothetical protein AUI50_08595 [Crenarchaeota archaeon 13_1_40CM_2_52_14]OLE69284.1 MAG: hypothetical protein AUF78_11815 [archaeon 13_1_20CM_2_51_12]